jgi:hypothetical protein
MVDDDDDEEIGRIYSSMSMIFNQQFVKKKKSTNFHVMIKKKVQSILTLQFFIRLNSIPFSYILSILLQCLFS